MSTAHSVLCSQHGFAGLQAGCRSLPLRRPAVQVRQALSVRASGEAAPALKKPEAPAAPSSAQEASTSKPAASSQPGVTIEYQRRQAKELQAYFRSLKVQETVERSKLFGWTPANEITNGRWVMFGLAVGLLTEYATGVDFIDQLKLMVSYLGIADIYD